MTTPDKVWERRHPEWACNHTQWRWLIDSYEGGRAYRHAVYGSDTHGLPIRNLVRHKREYPDPREANLAAYAADPDTAPTDDDYALRLARTPVPSFVAEVIDDHLDRVFAREIDRSAPAPLEAWWRDVDGSGQSIDGWMRAAVGPLLYLHGHLDVAFDHPPKPDLEDVATQADVARLKLDRCVARVILPGDVVWWSLEPITRRYLEVLVRECDADPATGERRERFRHWTPTGSTLYSAEGKVVEARPHAFGRVPIVRLFDQRKPRAEHLGHSRLEGIAEAQREFYNRDSELILSDTLQAHPLLQGPEDYVQADGSVPIGPSWLLPKKKNAQGGAVSYEGFEVVDFPKGAADSIRTNKQDLRDAVDRAGALAKPAGSRVAGGGGGNQVTAQSGLSKSYDHQALANRLAKVADVLERAERTIAEFAEVVLADGATPDPATVTIAYSRQFETRDSAELSDDTIRYQTALAKAGRSPATEVPLLQSLVRLMLPGRTDPEYAAYDADIARAVAEAATRLATADAAQVLTTDTTGVQGETSAPGGGPMKLTIGTRTVTTE